MKVAVISGKGGSGKSSVAAGLIDLAGNVVAVDCDVDASNLPLLFAHEVLHTEAFVSGQNLDIDPEKCVRCGKCVELCRFDALKADDDGLPAVNEFLCEGCGVCARQCPVQAVTITDEARSLICISRFGKGLMIHGDLKPGDDNSGKMIARIREIADAEMKRTGCPIQILDGPPGIGCPVLSTLTGVDKVVVVCEPTLSGLSDLRRAVTVARTFCSDIMAVVNKCDVSAPNARAIAGLCAENGIPVIAALPFSRQMVEAQMHCLSIVAYAPESECARGLRQAFGAIAGR